MVLKIQVEFSTPISIQGENAKNSMFVILEPYSQGETSTTIPNFAGGALDAANNGFKASTTHLGQTFTDVFETNPTNVEVNGKYLKLTLDSYFDDIYKFLKNFHFFYEEQTENGKIIRGDVAASLSQSTKSAVSISTGIVETTSATDPLEAKDDFEFKILKILIKDEEPDKIFYFYTSNRTLKIENTLNGQAINAVNGTFAVNVNDFLEQEFTNADEYYSNANANSGTAFAINNTAGVTIGQNTEGKFFSVQRDSASGRLTKNSDFNSASIKTTTYTTTDEFGFTLEIPNDTTTVLDNKIKNPTLHAEIIPSIGGDGYIAIKMSKTNGNSFLNMVGVTNDNNDSDRTIRHGGSDTDDVTTHPLASNNELTVSAGNAYIGLTTLDFNFKDDGTQEISNIISGNELKVEIDENGDDVILMRLNRFPRHGITYSIDYNHQLNLTSGIFDQYNHGVLAQNQINVSNQLKEVTATVGKLKVYYPPSKPGTFSDRPTGTAAASGDFDAYYYVDITFQRGGQDVDITAKYDVNKPTDETAFGYQADSGHKIHHGLIISKDNTDDNTAIFEDITRTTIRDQNGDPVTLGENSFGKFLRIEVPFAVGDPETGTAGAYPYDTSTSQLTSNNFADLNSTSPPGILLNDREEKDVGGTGTGSYYYINVMDSQGNVVKPFTESNLQTDNDWGKDKDGNTPSVSSIEYKVRWDSTLGDAGEWVKELVLTHNQDLQDPGVVNSLVNSLDLTNAGTSMNILDSVSLDTSDDSILTVAIVADDDTLLTADVAAGNIKLEYTKPGDANNLTNWADFEIEEYNGDDAKTVTLPTGNDSNPALPSFSSLSLGAIIDDTGSFSVPLTWTQSVDTNGIDYEVEQSTDGTNYTEATISAGPTISGATISGLSYNQAYTFRVRASTYEYGPYSSSVSLSAQVGPAGQLSNFSLANGVGPEVVASWDKPSNVTQFKIEYSDDIGVTWTPTEGLGTAAGFVETTDGGSTTVSYTFSSLNGNTNYTIRASYSTSSTSPYTYGDTVDDVLLTYPPKVEGLASATITTSGFTLSWTHITNVGNEDFSSYYVEQSDDNGANWTDITPGDGLDENTNSLDVSELDDATQYLFRVKAENSSGAGNWSDNLTVETLESAPVISINTQVSTPTNDTTPSFTLTSDKAGTIAITSSHNPPISLSSTTVNIGNTTFTFNTLAQGTYNVTVEVTNIDGEANTATLDEFEIDTMAPQFTSGEVPIAGTSLTINFGENLELGNGGSIEGFTINLTGQGDSSFTSVAFDQSDSKKIIFSGVTIYDTTSTTAVSVTYVQPTTQANRLRDGAGNLLAGFTSGSGSITNNSSTTYTPPTPPDTTGPSFGGFSYSVPAGDADFWDANTSKLSLDPGQSVTVTLSVDITDDTSASANITATIADANWTASNPDGNTFKWNRTFTNSETGNNGTTTTISGTTVTAVDEAGNSTTSGSTGNITVDKYVYEDANAANTSFDIKLLSGTDAKPGNVNFIVKYELNDSYTIRRDVDLQFKFSKDNTFDSNSVINSLSTDTNNKITNDDWNDDKYQIQAYDSSLSSSDTNISGIGPGEKYVKLAITYSFTDELGGAATSTTEHLFSLDPPSTITGYQSSHGSLVRADKPWYCVLDVSGNDNEFLKDYFNGNLVGEEINYFTLEKHNNIVKQDPATYDVINGYYDSTGNEIGVKFKLPQYRFVPDISYNREIISSSPTGTETWGVYDDSLTVNPSTPNTTGWMYRDDVKRKIGILEPEIKGYYIKGKDKNSTNNNSYDIILQPNQYGTWEDVSPTQTASGVETLYGRSVDISRDGKFVIVGEPEKVNGLTGNDAGYGVAHVYEVDDDGTLTAKGGEIKYPSSSRFGTAVAINGDGSRIAISDPGEETSTTHQGYILTYTFDPDPNVNDWTSESLNSSANGGGAYKIEGGETGTGTTGLYAKAGDKFGWCMEMSEDGKTIIVGAPGTESNTDTSKGYINVFQYIPPASLGPTQTPGGGVGVPQTIRFGLLDYIEGENIGDRFGFSVDMVKFQPEYIAVGAPGDQSVSVFRGELDTNTNTYSFKRRCSPDPDDSNSTGGDKTIGSSDDIGHSIKIENDWDAGTNDGTTEGDVTSIDFGYALGYTRDENGLHTLVVGAPEEKYQTSSGFIKGRIRIYVWDEDYATGVYQWSSELDKGGYNESSPTTTLGFNKGSSICIERNAKFFMVQQYGNNSTSNGRVNIYSKTPRYINDPDWNGTRLLPGSRWSYNGGRELGATREANATYFNDDYGKSIAISEGGEKIIIGGPFNDTDDGTGYITVHTPNSKYTSANGSATESNYTFTNQEKALFPVQQDNAPRGYIYDDRTGPTDSTNFGNLRNYEFIYMFNKWEIKGTNDSNYPYANIIDISGREMEWAVTAVNEYSRNTTGDELDVTSNDHFWSDSGTLGDYGNGNFINNPDIGDWIPRTPYDSTGALTELSKKQSSGGAEYKPYSDYENGIFDSSTVYDSSANITVEFDGATWVEGKTLFKPNNDFTGNYGNPSHQFFRTKSVVSLDISGTSNPFDATNGTYKKFEMLYDNDSFSNQYAPSVRKEFTGLKNNKYYDYYYHVVNTLCKTDLSGARYPSGTATESFLTAPGLPSMQYTNASDFKLIPASYDGTSTPTLATTGNGPGTLYSDLRYTFSWYVNNWYTNTAYGTTSLGSGVPDAYKSMFGSPDITSSTSLTSKRCNFGRAVAASKDGKIVAVSGKSWNGGSATDDHNGYVEVYQYSTDTLSWSKLGTTIYGNNDGFDKNDFTLFDPTGPSQPIHSGTGFSLDISDDGTILVVGEPEFYKSALNQEIGGGKFSSVSSNLAPRKCGKVRVFKYGTLVNGTNDWLQIGDDIIGEMDANSNSSTYVDARFGSSLAYLEYTDTDTQENKKVVCVGAPGADSGKGYVGLYELDLPQGVNAETTWNLSIQQDSSGQDKYKFTNADDENDVYGQRDSTATGYLSLPLEYGSKHIFDYSNITSHPFIISDTTNTLGPGVYDKLDAGDYNAFKLEYDTNNNKTILTIKETHSRAGGEGSKNNLVGKIQYTCQAHYNMKATATIDTCWSGGNATGNNLDAPLSPGNADDEFGFSVDIGYDSTDGLIIAVGSPGYQVSALGSNFDDCGRLDIYRKLEFINTPKWVPYPETTDVSTTTTPIIVGNTEGQNFGESGSYNGDGSRLGCTVSLSRDGTTLAVGAEGESYAVSNTSTYAGAVYVYELANSSWSATNVDQTQGTTYNFNKAFLSSNYTAYGHYGHSVKIFKDENGNKILVVGEPGMSDLQAQSGGSSSTHPSWTDNVYGRVHVYTNTGSNWANLKNIITTASSGDHSRTGDAVTASQDIVIVGSSFNTTEAVDGELGYVSVWSQDVYLTHLEDVTTTIDTTTNEAVDYYWNNNRLTLSLKTSGNNGHISNFNYTPISLDPGIFGSVSNRKERHDDWEEGPIVGIRT